MVKNFKSIFVKLEEMPGLRKKIEELLAEERNVALNSARKRLWKIYDTPQTEQCLWGRCLIQTRDYINGLYDDHKRWEKAREQKQAKQN